MSTRLDKYLAQSGEYTRTEAARLIRRGQVQLNGQTVREVGTHVNDGDEVRLDGVPVKDSRCQYYMLHKPAGVLTAARDRRASTVMDLVPDSLIRRKVLPVGRLDKDTTGLLLLTNDGALAHRLLSPKRHVWKRYLATVTGTLDRSDVEAFEQGVPLSDFTAMPAGLRLLHCGDEESRAEVELREGKFHQVKRMFQARGHEVTALHRIAFGPLVLGDELPVGAYRPLTDEELGLLRQSAGMSEGGAQGDG